MTNCQKDTYAIEKQDRKKSVSLSVSVQKSALALCAVFFMILILKNSRAAIDYTSELLILCSRTVVPSLFPFMVLSDVLLNLNVGDICQRLTPKWLCSILGISARELFIFIIGILCGFPVGAKAAGKMYSLGELDKNEVERVLTYSSIPSAAFVIGTVGISMYKNQRIGIIIYVSVLTSALISMQLWRAVKKDAQNSIKIPHPKHASTNARADLAGAISRSAKAMLNICAFVTFFGTVCKILTASIFKSSFFEPIIPLVSGALEMSSGVKQSSHIPNLTLSICASAMICAWSGFSVHLQIISTLESELGSRSVSLKPYFLHKLLQCVIAGVICYFISSYLL